MPRTTADDRQLRSAATSARRARGETLREARPRHRASCSARSRARARPTSTPRSPPPKAAQPAWAATHRRSSAARILRADRPAAGARRRATIAAIVAARDRQVAEGRARRDRRGDRDGLLRRRRGPALLRPDDDQRRAEPAGDDRPPAARRRRADHRRQHADRQRRLEGVPGAAVRQRRRAQGVRGHAARRRSAFARLARRGRAARRRLQRRPRLRRRGRRAAGRAPRRRASSASPARRAVGRWIAAIAGRAAGEGLPRARRQEPARSSATTPTSRTRRRGRSRCRRSATPASAAPRAAASSCSTPSTTRSASCCVERDRARCRSAPATSDDFGPVINEAQLTQHARRGRARAARRARRCSTGGERLTGAGLRRRLLHGADDARGRRRRRRDLAHASCSARSPCLYRVADFEEAIALANDSPFGLTASIHTAERQPRAWRSSTGSRPASPSVNGGTYGSEPHMPFGGLRQSGNGWREAGHRGARRLLGLKTVYINHDPGARLSRPAPSRRRADPRAAGLEAGARQERPRRSAATRCSPTRSPRRSRAASSTR